MKFSVVMASRLIIYSSAAKDRENKLLRAINSVLQQTFPDWELLIVADGCKATVEIVSKYADDERVSVYEVEHKHLWSGTPRNTGIEKAKGQWIIYLDNDDVYGEDHLRIVDECTGGYDWVWWNDFRWRPRLNYWYENHTDAKVIGMIGTSNIAHKKSLGVFWDVNGKYSHDYKFVQKLLPFKNNAKINTPGYFVCHIPGTMISGGYDL